MTFYTQFGRNQRPGHHQSKDCLYQCSETNVMQFFFSLLRIKGPYMFRALHAHPQEALSKSHLVYCARVMPVGCCFFSGGGRRGAHIPKHFVNLTGESKNFKMLEFPLNQLQTCYVYLCDVLSFM
jgi:hypothetical protein